MEQVLTSFEIDELKDFTAMHMVFDKELGSRMDALCTFDEDGEIIEGIGDYEYAKLFFEKWLDEHEQPEKHKELTEQINVLLRKYLPEAAFDEYFNLSSELEAKIEERAWLEGYVLNGLSIDFHVDF